MHRQLSIPTASSVDQKQYHFGAILSVGMGNMTRYLSFRKYAERDAAVNFVWAPVKHFIAPDEPNPLRYLPEPFYTRAVILYQSAPVLRQLHRFDAVLFHMFEAYTVACCRNLFRKQPLLIWNNDDPPVVSPATHPLYPKDRNKALWRHQFRLSLDRVCAKRTEAFIPWSRWGNDILVSECGIPRETVQPIHPGLDLELWSAVAAPNVDTAAKAKILFVGGDFVRKGGDLLLQVFSQQFADSAELHLVTKESLAALPNVYVYPDLAPNDRRLAQLYAQADLFVLPTTADLSSWACLEAMASGCAVISTSVGGVGDIVRHNETGLVIPIGDAAALATAMRSLLENPTLRHQMGVQGRKVVEREFNAAVNVPRVLAVMKAAVDRKRATNLDHHPAAKKT
ncbi:MAG: glycosyltransferase family 4 protein [Tildeniella nuda ZEHNDER 1965/U140]|jgi:glycosyltransferase involved in cell wall biosynthesis|nr:glycosyltransferase family 4 protein [Tildeniella nuda ZEHNDER 1965/U140]